ncbi:MAG: phosphatase PAP2 family protein [Eggerthia catenaformis]|uniref:phosphatase PAP2 family protein n=1 Tax=Eggerthia catenaformis TaxID=31973 RepID=UPI003F9EDB8C
MNIFIFIQMIDHLILSFYHQFALMTQGTFNTFFRIISYSAETRKALPILIFAIILLIFKKTRKAAFCMIIAMLLGTIFVDLIKGNVARIRPFKSGNPDYLIWWKYAGSVSIGEYSFPSGHTTAAMAAMSSLFIYTKKKISWIAFIYVLLMGMSRNYLMVHYPSDVLGGILTGLCAALAGYVITQITVYFINCHQNNKFFYYIKEGSFFKFKENRDI